MKKYEQVRSKIKNYIDALKERYSTNELRVHHPEVFSKEFGVSFTLPMLLKKNGYTYCETNNYVTKIMLTPKFWTLDEVTAHILVLEYSKAAYHRKQKRIKKEKLKEEKAKEKELKKQENNEVTQKRLDSKTHYEKVRRKYKKRLKEDTKTIGVRIPYSDYEAILLECKRTNSNVTKYFNQLIKDSGLDSYKEPAKKSIEEVKDTLLKDPNFKDSFKKQLELPLPKVAKRGRPYSNPDTIEEIEGAYYPTTRLRQVNFPLGKKVDMKTLDEYNESKKHPQSSSYQENGILCPTCKAELFDTNRLVIINEKTPVHCNCGFIGSRYL
jgi:hypothetical protein